ncbi:hypothetical protein EV360DRAFT_77650 [Lentinula raphanica]|nr:hypothetical protein EV360DRAFT_77650 [Lentinula raphanica]
MSPPQIRAVSSEEGEIAQLVRRITAAKLEIEKLRAEIDELTQQELKNSALVLQPFNDLSALHTEVAALLERKRLDIGKLEQELLSLRKSNP